MKTTIRSLAVLAALGTAAYAAPFLAMGDSAELFLTGTLGLRADDNVTLSADKNNDMVFEFVPGFEVVYGQNSLTKGRAFYKETITRYTDQDKLNTTLSSVGFDGKYDDQKLKVNFAASFAQLAQNSVDVRPTDGTLTRRDVTNLSGVSEVSVTDKSSVAAGVTYDKVDYKRKAFTSTETFTVPVNYYFEVSPKLDMSVGIQYRDNSLKNAVDSKDYFYSVGARGEFTPKLTGKLAVGVTQRKYDGSGNESSVGIDSSFAYAASEKTSVQFGVTNDFGYSGQGQSQRNLTFSGGVQSRMAEDWTVGGNLAYRVMNYLGKNSRTDDYVDGTLSATYVFNSFVNFTGSYTYRENSSDLKFASFDNNVFAIAANVRY
ncbi:MAG: outer membrane beta-barrel protein [Opitutae bacterium]|nr:outer membrane beta-barrel protein [Opitutae bacterium]